jgi:hypothetical protein
MRIVTPVVILMIRHILGLTILMVALAVVVPQRCQAAESYDNCTGFIASLPAVITSPGTWCLKQDLTTAITSGDAIGVASDNVIVDCNSHRLDGTSAGIGTQTSGMHAQGHINTTIRHCDIRGFHGGVVIESGSPAFGVDTIEDNRFDGNTYVGILSYNKMSLIQRNQVLNTGNSTSPSDSVYGITTMAPTYILGNTVSGVTARSGTGYAGVNVYGIIVQGGVVGAPGPPGSISDNRVRGLTPAGTGAAFGILFSSSGRFQLAGNDVVAKADSTQSGFGLYCNADSKGRAKGNVVAGFGTGIANCGDAGDNDVTP